MTKHFNLIKGTRVLFAAFLTTYALLSVGYTAKLSDLIKRAPQLFLPSQILPGQTTTFTVKGKPGKQVKLILSDTAVNRELDSGVTLRVGEPVLEKEVTIPETGVVQIPVEIPQNIGEAGQRKFVEAIVWSSPDQSDAEVVQIIESSGNETTENAVMVGAEPDRGNTILVPGDPNLANVMRTLDTLSNTSQDPRKRDLIDSGAINRKRQLDSNLYNNTRF